jgi:hypothetical protein
MLSILLEWLALELEKALNLDVIKAFPIWRRPGVTNTDPATSNLPTASLFFATIQRTLTKRVGDTRGGRSVVFEVYLFCRHERELTDTLDLFEAWSERTASADVNNIRVSLTIPLGNRLPNEHGLQQEEHAFYCPITISWNY